MALATALAVVATTWFGPVQATFDADIPGNPYDHRANDVRAVFVAADGHREERLAYFDDGHWKAWLVTTHPGDYRASLTRNGEALAAPALPLAVPGAAAIAGGFVHAQGTRFVTDAGHPYFPLGHNLGWQTPGLMPLAEQLGEMGRAGMNWSRIWACPWDGKNPFYSRGTRAGAPAGAPPEAIGPPPGELAPEALRRWDEIVAAADAAGVRFQFVLFHHGLFSTTTNPNWPEHPWNQVNGGFLARAQDFFTDATARDYTRRWLRHAVARWGHSPAVLAWELFNEVEWVDLAAQDKDWATIAAWHAEMAAFLRSIDPYHHLIATSSETEYPALYEAVDFYQPHTYPRDVFTTIAGTASLPGKPWFFGEFGRGAAGPGSDEARVVRDGIWAALLFGHAGASSYWYWDRVVRQNLAPEYTRAARILALSSLPSRTTIRPMAVEIAGARPAPLQVWPGRGWGATTRHRFELPREATPARLVELSSYLEPATIDDKQRAGKPVEFAFTAPDAGTARIALASISPTGAALRVLLDGTEVANRTYAPTYRPAVPPVQFEPPKPPEPVDVAYAAGPHVLTLESVGNDWVQFDHVTIADLGRSIVAHATGEKDFALARVTAIEGGAPATIDLRFDGLADGAYALKLVDLDTGAESALDAAITGGVLEGFELTGRDVALILQR